MNELLNQIFELFVHSCLGIILALIVVKFSLLLFNINMIEEIKKGNNAAALLCLGILLMIGLIIGLSTGG